MTEEKVSESIPRVAYCHMCHIETGKPKYENIKSLNIAKGYNQMVHGLKMREFFGTMWLCDRHFEEIK